MSTKDRIHCMLCSQPIPAGEKHPEYFAMYGLSWEPGQDERDHMMEHIEALFDHCETIQSALYKLRDVNRKNEAPSDLETKLAGLFAELCEEAFRRAERLRDAIWEAYDEAEQEGKPCPSSPEKF